MCGFDRVDNDEFQDDADGDGGDDREDNGDEAETLDGNMKLISRVTKECPSSGLT